VFHRGQTNPDLFPRAEKIIGDRETDIAKLEGRSWDVAIDTCGYLPRVVRESVTALADRVGRYVFISSVSAYADFQAAGRIEDDPLAELPDPNVEEITEKTYGGLKSLCEDEVKKAVGERAFVVRPGLIVGPFDHTDRFSYWPHRMSKGGTVLAPGDGTTPIQVIDARDLATWVVWAAERGVAGFFNAVGPTISFSGLLTVCEEVTEKGSTVRWVDEAFLLEEGVEPWSDMPLWIPASDPDSIGFGTVDAGRAMGAGLSFRSLPETITDTLEWLESRPGPLAAGLTEEREAELLAKWKTR
jgi:2'-hydroxyisoflavone reductase